MRTLYLFQCCFLFVASGDVYGIVSDESGLQKIDFQLRWHHQFQFAGYYAALEKEYYREVGLDVQLHEASPVGEVMAGRVQYAKSNSGGLYARTQGKLVVALAAILPHSPSVLLALNESHINTPHDLVGKKVMLLNPDADAYFHAMLLSQGVDIGMVDIVPSSLDFEDLISGRVVVLNSYRTNEPFILQWRGIEYSVVDPAVYGVDFYSDVSFTTEQELQEHPERAKAFLKASLKGWCYVMGHRLTIKIVFSILMCRMGGIICRPFDL